MRKKMKGHNEEGPPCQRMEALLQQVADGSATGIKRWYAVSHAARCFRCGNFLQRLRLSMEVLKATRGVELDPDAVARLRAKVREIAESD